MPEEECCSFDLTATLMATIVRNEYKEINPPVHRFCKIEPGKMAKNVKLNIIMQRTANENAACLRRIRKSFPRSISLSSLFKNVKIFEKTRIPQNSM